MGVFSEILGGCPLMIGPAGSPYALEVFCRWRMEAAFTGPGPIPTGAPVRIFDAE